MHPGKPSRISRDDGTNACTPLMHSRRMGCFSTAAAAAEKENKTKPAEIRFY